MRYLFVKILTIGFWINTTAQGTISTTYSSGDIPTSLSTTQLPDFNDYDPSCTGPVTTVSITLPAGEAYQVTGIDISYTMTPDNGGLEFDQQSYIHCQNSSKSELQIYTSYLNDGNPVNYNRTNIDIANGLYPGGTTIVFEMRAWRTYGGTSPDCGTDYQKIDNNTWSITLHHGAETTAPPRVGIGTDTPDFSAMLDIVSSDKGLLVPRMTSLERVSISNPANGLLIYDTDEGAFWYMNQNTWESINQDELPAGGTNGNKLTTDGAGNYYWSVDAIDDADNDPNNEIEIPSGGSNGQILSTDGSGTYSWVSDQINDADSDPANEIELPDGGLDGQILSTNGNGVYSWVNQNSGGATDKIVDTDNDTEVFVQDGSSNDFIRFTLEGVERYRIDKNTLEPSYSGLYIGQEAGFNTTASNNTYIGNYTGESNITGSWNTALGHAALRNATNSENVAIGGNSLLDLTSGRYNTALGTASGQSVINGERNVFLGYDAGRYASGSTNVFVGNDAGKNATGSSSIFIGSDAGENETESDKLYIENSNSTNPLIYGDFADNEIGLNGDVAINANTPNVNAALDINSTTKGLLIPRMTEAQRLAIVDPPNGLMVFQTEDYNNEFWYFDEDYGVSGGWKEMTHSASEIRRNDVFMNINSSGSIRAYNGSQYHFQIFSNGSINFDSNYSQGKFTFDAREETPTNLVFMDYDGMGAGDNILRLDNNASSSDDSRFIDCRHGSSSRYQVYSDGRTQIGLSPIPDDYMLSVDGKIVSEEVLIQYSSSWPDYVFQDDYKLRSLPELEKYIQANKHLPNIPAAKEVEANGLLTSDMITKQMEKIEELTLYIIELEKRIAQLESVSDKK